MRHSPQILCVDDRRSNLDPLVKMLEGKVFHFVLATNGPEFPTLAAVSADFVAGSHPSGIPISSK